MAGTLLGNKAGLLLGHKNGITRQLEHADTLPMTAHSRAMPSHNQAVTSTPASECTTPLTHPLTIHGFSIGIYNRVAQLFSCSDQEVG